MLTTPVLWTLVEKWIHSDDSDIVDTGAGAIDETAEVDATDEGAPSDDKTADDPNSLDTSMAVDNKVDSKHG